LLLCASRTIAERKVEVKDRWASTESRAATGKVQWAAGSLLSRLGFGKYQAGEVDGHILVRNRESGLLEEEFIPAFVRLGIQLLYRNRVSQSAAETAVVERMLKKASVAHGVSYDLPVSKAVIPSFVATYSINVNEIEKPLSKYTTMNEFFGRRLKPGARRLEDPDDPNCVPSVADCRLTVFPTNAAAEKIWIKGSGFSIGRLLDDPIRGKEFEGATLAIHRLAPQDYHRWNVPLSGRILGFKKIRHPGQYYTVNPMAIRSPVDVFGDNVRDICYIDTGTKLGTVALVAVGAMMVASIIWSVTEGQEVKKFDDMGTFHFGGSTVIVLFKKGTVKLDQDLIESSERALETVLRVGDRIGTMIV
jgi:phosphatidylserine decarboxylase